MQKILPEPFNAIRQQQDVAELLIQLLDSASQWIQGKTIKKMQCAWCMHKLIENKDDKFEIYPLPINNDAIGQTDSLVEALRRQCDAEFLEGDHPYRCTECSNSILKATQTTTFTSLPSFWFISLNTFNYDPFHGTSSKIMIPVSTPEVMTFNKDSFRLIAVMVHVGTSLRMGHYMTYFNDADCELPKTTWFLADDAEVNMVPDVSIQVFLTGKWPDRQTPYVLLYKKITNTI